MKTMLILSGAVIAMILMLSGCISSSAEYYEELTPSEEQSLVLGARKLALQGKAVPPHMMALFMDKAPSRRIVYDGDKYGKATFRWELYDTPKNPRRITQKDINPHWIMVIATGDLRDPEWKLTFARENPDLQTRLTPPQRNQQSDPRYQQRQRRQIRGNF